MLDDLAYGDEVPSVPELHLSACLVSAELKRMYDEDKGGKRVWRRGDIARFAASDCFDFSSGAPEGSDQSEAVPKNCFLDVPMSIRRVAVAIEVEFSMLSRNCLSVAQPSTGNELLAAEDRLLTYNSKAIQALEKSAETSRIDVVRINLNRQQSSHVASVEKKKNLIETLDRLQKAMALRSRLCQ